MEQPEGPSERAEVPQERRGFFARLLGRNSTPVPEVHIRTMDGPVHFLTNERLQEVPDIEGIVALWEGTTLIYLGAASQNLGGMRGEIQSKRGAGCTQSATHFQFEASSDSSSLLQDLLNEHRRQHGSLPRCNQ
jgi:hypothetical protein